MLAVAMAVAFVAPVAHAADLPDDGGSWVTDSATPYYGYSAQDTGGSWVTDSATPYYGYGAQDTSGTWVTDSATPYYGYSTPSYSTGGYGTTGYSTGGYSTGGYSTGGGYMIGGGYGYNAPIATAPSNTYAPVNTWDNGNTYAPTNTCVGNSCNKDDHSVVNITNPAPVINNNNVVANYAQPAATSYATQQYCQSGYSGTYPNCYRQQPIVYQQPPVAYNTATPYVSLSQVPYTGLDLGFWGSIAYWGAFVLFALFAAYLIAIKRVQNNIAAYLKSVLFGADEEVIETADVVTAPSAPAPAPLMEGDVIDSFIMSQINRARA